MHAFNSDSDRLERTAFVPTLDTPIPDGKSAVWCASFQLAWDKLKEDVIKGPVEITNAVIEENGKRLVLSIVRDVSERKQAEEALRQALSEVRRDLTDNRIALALIVVSTQHRDQLEESGLIDLAEVTRIFDSR